MKKEEAIRWLMQYQGYEQMDDGVVRKHAFDLTDETVDALLTALRPVSREQVEKMRGKFFQAGIDDVAQDTWRCSRCLVQEFGNIQGINFCPSCGAPMTDEAVDMVMERLEALRDE